MPARSRLSLLVLLSIAANFLSPAGVAAEEAPLERTLSPYFLVEGGDPSVDRFPLESTHVAVAVSGVIADVTVTQAYRNDGARPLNARYVFPASTRAAVSGMRMTLRDQVIEAQIQERKEAQRTFERARASGRNASLLEQQRPNVFQMSVANVTPGERIEVSFRYTELLVPSEGRYEFVFPTVVGPRYGASEERPAAEERWIASPTLAEGAPPPAPFALEGVLAAGLPIQAAGSPTHALVERFEGPALYRFELDGAEALGADRDFVLHYRLAGDAIQSGLSLYDAGDEKFFLLLVEPPARVSPAAMPPRELVFVVDVSGSMHGFPLDTAKQLLRRLAATLRPVDRFNVLLFSGGSRLLAPQSLPATRENVAAALAVIDGEQGGGGTELLPALERALALSPARGVSRSFLIVTDGYVGADAEAMRHVAQHLGEANVFAFGIGSSVNRHLIEGLARAGLGEAFVVTQPAEAEEVAAAFADYVSTPVLADVTVAFDGFGAYDVEPRAIPDLLAERPLVVFGKYRGPAAGAIHVGGLTGAGAFASAFDVASVAPHDENRALVELWARSRVAALSDFGFGEPAEAARAGIRALGLRYGLLTRETSFVAVARRTVNPGGEAADVTQPLPLPRGISASAVGVGPEPGLALLAAVLAAACALRLAWRRAAAA
jgi:Ca-activated chloride channel family protein